MATSRLPQAPMPPVIPTPPPGQPTGGCTVLWSAWPADDRRRRAQVPVAVGPGDPPRHPGARPDLRWLPQGHQDRRARRAAAGGGSDAGPDGVTEVPAGGSGPEAPGREEIRTRTAGFVSGRVVTASLPVATYSL